MAKSIKPSSNPNNSNQVFDLPSYFNAYRSQIQIVNDQLQLLENNYTKEKEKLLAQRNKIADEFSNFKNQVNELGKEIGVNKSGSNNIFVKTPTRLTRGFLEETERALEANKKSMHINEILRLNNIEITPTNASTNYSRLKKSEKFRNEGRQMWALSKWPKAL